MFEKFRRAARRNELLHKMEASGDIRPLIAHLGEYPAENQAVAEYARARIARTEFWAGLLATAALAATECREAAEPLAKLAEETRSQGPNQTAIPWSKLPQESIREMRVCLRSHHNPDIAADLLGWVPGNCALAVLDKPGDPFFEEDLTKYVECGHSSSAAAMQINQGIEDVWRTAGRSELDTALRPFRKAAEIFWAAGSHGACLSLLNNLDLTGEGRIPEQFLDVIAEGLDMWEGLDLARAASLLERHAEGRWVAALQNCWVKIHQKLETRNGTPASQEFLVRQPAVEIMVAGCRILTALAACAAADERYTSAGDAPDSAELDRLHAERKALADEHEEAQVKYLSRPPGRNELARRARDIRNRVWEIDGRIKALSDGLLRTLPPGRLLLLVLQNAHVYPSELRQAAAWAALRLVEKGQLDDASKALMVNGVRRAVSGKDPADLEQSVAGLVADEQARAAAVHAAMTYFHSRNRPEFAAALDGLELAEETRQEIVVRYETFAKAVSHHFEERVVRLLPGQSFLELEENLVAGLVWMADLLEDSGEEAEDGLDYSQVRVIITMLSEHAPGCLDFLVRYPLRLMTLEQHKHLLGQYSRSRGGLSYWTRFTPPAWRPGMANPGKVLARYLEFDDRSTPNSMGIWTGLFRHPVLALPVIYREFLHYGGPDGVPAEGIENETEVLIREILFARALIAGLAPEHDDEIPGYERSLVDHLHAAGIPGLGRQLKVDLENGRDFQWILEGIVSAYGLPFAGEEATREISRKIGEQNARVDFLNDTSDELENWYPEIKWPRLQTARTEEVTKWYLAVLRASLTVDHRIDTARRDAILEQSSGAREAWKSYCGRPGALSELGRYSSASHDAERLAAIVNRVGAVPGEGAEAGGQLATVTLRYLLATPVDELVDFSERVETIGG